MNKPTILNQLHSMGTEDGEILRKTIFDVKRKLGDTINRYDSKLLNRVYILGCGTSFYAALVCKHAFEKFAGIASEGAEAFAFEKYQDLNIVNKSSMVIGFSTSGETDSIVSAFKNVKKRGALTVAVTALDESTIAKTADEVLLTGSVDEVNVPRSKAQLQGLLTIYVLAIFIGREKGYLSVDQSANYLDQLNRMVSAVAITVNEKESQIINLAKKYWDSNNIPVLGSGVNYGTALAGALMITEMAKLHSWGDELENFLHGRFREVNQAEPLILLAPKGSSSARVLDFLTVTDFIKAQTIVITDEVSIGIDKLATHVITLPGGIDEIMTPILFIVPLFIFGNHLAKIRGENPDMRRYTEIIPTKTKYRSDS
jgi:glutamine---fructose-6-phosphate transaminase (isomerizing)